MRRLQQDERYAESMRYNKCTLSSKQSQREAEPTGSRSDFETSRELIDASPRTNTDVRAGCTVPQNTASSIYASINTVDHEEVKKKLPEFTSGRQRTFNG